MHGQEGLLLRRLDGHKAHAGAGHGLTDGLRVGAIVLVGLDVWLDELRRDQAHRVAEALQLARPKVRTRAGLQADQAGRQRGEELGHLSAAQRLAEDDAPGLVNAVHVKDVLGQIDANGDSLHGGRSCL